MNTAKNQRTKLPVDRDTLSQTLQQTLTIQEAPTNASDDTLELLDLAEDGGLDDFNITEFGAKCLCKAFLIIDVSARAGDDALVESMRRSLDAYEGTPDRDDVEAVIGRFPDGHEARKFVVGKLAEGISGKGIEGVGVEIEMWQAVDEGFGRELERSVGEMLEK